MKEKRTFLGIEFLRFDLSEICKQIVDNSESKCSIYHLVNAYTITCALNSDKLLKILREDKIVCDSRVLSLIFRIRSLTIPQNRGIDIFKKVIEAAEIEHTHFFIGSTSEVLSMMHTRLLEINPDLVIGGLISPSFTDDFTEEIDGWAELIRSSENAIVWIGLGTPKQDLIAKRLSKRIDGSIICIGAAFDFLSGNKMESPKLVSYVGLEWLFRLVSEPRRLWRRYTISNIEFLIAVFNRKNWF